jgi:hypothetical protein
MVKPLRGFYPWGSVLQNVIPEFNKQSDDEWLYRALRSLRRHTIENFPAVITELDSLKKHHGRKAPTLMLGVLYRFSIQGLTPLLESDYLPHREQVARTVFIEGAATVMESGAEVLGAFSSRLTKQEEAVVPASIMASGIPEAKTIVSAEYVCRLHQALRASEQVLEEFLAQNEYAFRARREFGLDPSDRSPHLY